MPHSAPGGRTEAESRSVGFPGAKALRGGLRVRSRTRGPRGDPTVRRVARQPQDGAQLRAAPAQRAPFGRGASWLLGGACTRGGARAGEARPVERGCAGSPEGSFPSFCSSAAGVRAGGGGSGQSGASEGPPEAWPENPRARRLLGQGLGLPCLRAPRAASGLGRCCPRSCGPFVAGFLLLRV